MQTELVLVQEVLALLPQNRGEQVAVVREEPRRFGRPLRAALDGGTVLSLVTGARAWRSATARAAAAANIRKRIMVMLPMVAASDAALERRTDRTRDEQLMLLARCFP